MLSEFESDNIDKTTNKNYRLPKRNVFKKEILYSHFRVYSMVSYLLHSDQAAFKYSTV